MCVYIYKNFSIDKDNWFIFTEVSQTFESRMEETSTIPFLLVLCAKVGLCVGPQDHCRRLVLLCL